MVPVVFVTVVAMIGIVDREEAARGDGSEYSLARQLARDVWTDRKKCLIQDQILQICKNVQCFIPYYLGRVSSAKMFTVIPIYLLGGSHCPSGNLK